MGFLQGGISHAQWLPAPCEYINIGQACHKQTIKTIANLQDQLTVILTFKRDLGLCLVSDLLINCILTILQK